MKPLKNTFIFCAILIFSLNNSLANQNIINEANILMKKAVMADNKEELNLYLHEIKELTIKNQDNKTLNNMYANILTSTGKYKEAYIEYKKINEKKENPSVKLLECMLQEKIDRKYLPCYQDAISLYEKNNITDINYIIALILGEDKRANDKKVSYLKENKVDELEEYTLSISRDAYIRLILP
ncbi:Uncharacterised protein [Yersinia similis]|uniref:hypothetical protein n=1 Tax=Yersinia similis TaxID=367190 RepID=UPI0005DE920A|nr:hypothetical protein [Yersinia similis]CNF38903.1 Uncharacterised protein [Yersinia similis]